MRIVAGAARGRRLAAPAPGTRPTSDRAREALFSSLAGLLDIDGARVLDLFAGTGAVGLEALSRGAAAATFVESDPAAFETLRRNVATVGLPGAELHRRTAADHVAARTAQAQLAGSGVAFRAGGPYDLVFADPPYALADAELATLLATLVTSGRLTAGGIVVVERSARGSGPRWPDEMEPIKQKRYGEGVLWYGRRR